MTSFFHFDKKIQTDIIVLDFSKAFDTVPHKRLLAKLHHYGIQNNIHKWISSFLSGRTQTVLVDGVESTPVKVLSGVPQGTVLGPILFLLHINDLPLEVDSTVRLFADDCLLYRNIRSIQDQVSLQKDLLSLQEWGLRWGMRFNVKKCNILRISRTAQPLSYTYSLNNEVLATVQNAKYLGIDISADLKWSTHVNSVANRANSSLGTTIVRPVMEYASEIWDPHLQKDIDSLERVQRRAARFVVQNYDFRASVSQILSELGWDSLAARREDRRMLLMFGVVCGLVAVSEADLVDGTLATADQRTRSNNPFKLKHLPATTNAYRRSFFPNTIPAWNNLPIDTETTVPTLKNYLHNRRHPPDPPRCY